MSTYRYLDASTAHLTAREMEDIAAAPPRVIKHEYGAWVHVPPAEHDHDDIEDQIADGDWDDFPNLLAAIRHARTLGDDVNWINFDADADQVEGLTSFDWDEPKSSTCVRCGQTIEPDDGGAIWYHPDTMRAWCDPEGEEQLDRQAEPPA